MESLKSETVHNGTDRVASVHYSRQAGSTIRNVVDLVLFGGVYLGMCICYNAVRFKIGEIADAQIPI